MSRAPIKDLTTTGKSLCSARDLGSMIDKTIPTSEFFLAVQWLGCLTDNGRAIPAGSGIVVHHQNGEYLATALHVAKDCKFQPLLRRSNQWLPTKWETIGLNDNADVAVLRTSTFELSHLTPQYGLGGVLIGAVGRAMGFPALDDPKDVSHIGELSGVPMPLTTLISAYMQPGTNGGGGIHFLGGYINAGFSGGAILLPTQEGWTIGGIITHRGGVCRNVYRKNPQTQQFERDKDLVIAEPSGLIRFAGFKIVTDLIEENLKRS